ncbi:MAG: hydrogen peroxide-inducible genes activator [Candidatus Caenarcaniphilales bacterium]|nr:hydrogen peroxide-inducible genes activator [Candidatus Caenarcaniphilales bacterium]
MNYSDISLKDISYLLTLAEYKHFGKAAEALYLSQPALSKQIKQIETILGHRIFERNKRRISITDIGLIIIEQAKEVANSAQKLIESASVDQEPLSGDLRLGIIASSGPYLIPRILKDLIKQYPKLHLIVREGYTKDLIEKLKQSQLDLVIAAKTFTDESLEFVDLFFEPFTLITAKNTKLAERKFVTEADIDPSQMILLEEGNCLSDQVWALCPSKNLDKKLRYQASSIETLHYMVASGSAYSLVPELVKSKEREIKSMIKYIDFKKKSIGRKMVMVFRKNYFKKDDLILFADLIKSKLPVTI